MQIKSSLTKRDLDGIYLRVQVDGKWENRCLTDLSWEEVLEWAETREPGPEFWQKMARHFHQRLRAIGDQLDLSTKEE